MKKEEYGNEKWRALSDKPGNDEINHITDEGLIELMGDYVKLCIKDFSNLGETQQDINRSKKAELAIKNSPLLEGFDRQAIMELMKKTRRSKEKIYKKKLKEVKKYSELLKDYREEKGLDEEEIAKLIGINVKTLNYLEKVHVNRVERITLKKLEKFFNELEKENGQKNI